LQNGGPVIFDDGCCGIAQFFERERFVGGYAAGEIDRIPALTSLLLLGSYDAAGSTRAATEPRLRAVSSQDRTHESGRAWIPLLRERMSTRCSSPYDPPQACMPAPELP
jgi:hypothetical protein